MCSRVACAELRDVGSASVLVTTSKKPANTSRSELIHPSCRSGAAGT